MWLELDGVTEFVRVVSMDYSTLQHNPLFESRGYIKDHNLHPGYASPISCSPRNMKSSGAVIVGIVVGLAVMLLIIALAICWADNRGRYRREHSS